MEPTVAIAFPPPVDRSSWTAHGAIDRLDPTGGRLVELKLRDLGASESMKIHVWPGDQEAIVLARASAVPTVSA
jgi:hypothetical protein